MDKYYFIERNGQKDGPFKLNELKDQKIFENDLVWSNHIENWTEAKNLEELKAIIFIKPPQTKNELIEENISIDNQKIKEIVIFRIVNLFLILTIVCTAIAYNNTKDFMSHSLSNRNGKEWYYFSESLFTRSINAAFNNCTIESGEYDSDFKLLFNLSLSSLLLFLIVCLPLGYVYFLLNRSTKEHYQNI